MNRTIITRCILISLSERIPPVGLLRGWRLPLYVPVLIMGAGAVEMASAGMGGQGQLLLLGAMLVVAAAFAPWAIAAALRISVE